MAEPLQKFRSALNGFNREDVVQFIQDATAQHDAELSALKDDNLRLQEAVRQHEDEAVSLRAKLAQLESELKSAKELLETVTAPQAAPKCPDWSSEELAAYRRAEEVERQSRERAAQVQQDLAKLISQASLQMDDANASLSEIMQQLNANLLSLRTAMDAGKTVLNDTATALHKSSKQIHT